LDDKGLLVNYLFVSKHNPISMNISITFVSLSIRLVMSIEH